MRIESSSMARTPGMKDIIPFPAYRETLPNGLKLIVMPMPANGLVAYWSIVRTGSRDEYESGHTGFAHFFEHMMFRGTRDYPAARYQEILTGIGADANAFTTDDLTAYHLCFAAEDLEQVMTLESDRFRHLEYSEQDFKNEAGAVYGEYRKMRMSPLFTLYEAMAKTAFTQHPYGHTTMGYEQDIAAMPSMAAYSREFFRRYYRPDNTVLFVAGDVKPEAVAALTRRYYADWEPGYVAPPLPQEPVQQQERRIEVHYDGRTLPVLWLAYKIDHFDPRDTRRVAADVLAELAFGPTSELYRRLVLEERLVEFLIADANRNRDPGLFDVYTRIKDPAHVERVLAALDTAIHDYQHSAVSSERLDAVKAHLRYELIMGLDTPSAVAQQLARPLALSGDLEDLETLYRAYAGLDADAVQAAAQHYLASTRRTVAVLRGRA
jgi:zinc protease